MMFSITIPVYNNEDGLKKSLESLIGQTYPNWEAIVVDDGSENSIENLIKQFNDNRIKFYRFEKNGGRPKARQKTFELINGEYIGFLDAGDLYTNNFIKNAMEVLTKSPILGVSQSMIIKYKGEQYKSNYDDVLIDLNHSKYSSISFASTVFKAEVCHNYQFDNKLKFSQDRHFLNYIAENFQGEVYLKNSHAYIYDQGDRMKLKTTFNKYFYSATRLIREGRHLASGKTVCKMIMFLIIQFFFGYDLILKMRYKKI